MEFLRFIFSSFWVWLGFVILLSMIGGGVLELVKACKRNRKATAYRIGQRWRVEIENASNASQYFQLYGGQDGTAALLVKRDADIMSTIYQTQYKGLDVITSNMDLYSADRELWADEERDQTGSLKEALRRAAADYDYCVIDNGPAIDVITLNILVAADDVLIPVRPDDFSIAGMVDLLEQIGHVKILNPGLTVRGTFFTHWQNRETFGQARAALEESGICPVLQTAISYNPKVSESTFAHTPLCVFAGRSWAAIQYKKLTAEYLALTDSGKGKEG